MRKSQLVISAAASAVALAILTPGLASAADTEATFTVAGGLLEIAAPATQPLTVSGDAGDDQEASGTAEITVTDARQIVGGWVASASSTDFAGATGTVPAANVDYLGTDVETTGTVTAAAVAGNLGTEVPVLNATAVTGANTVTWNGGITVALPADVVADTYAATITHSVA